MAAGTATLLQSISRRQIDEGAHVSVFYLSRPESPSPAELRQHFNKNTRLKSFTVGHSKFKNYIALVKALFQAENSDLFDVIHLHSAKAGIIGRIVHLFSSRSTKIFYSPHGFAFLREDLPSVMRGIIRHIESLLSLIGDGLILTCKSEKRIADDALISKHTFIMNTGVDEHSIVQHGNSTGGLSRDSEKGNRRPRVGIVARVTYQKAPWKFRAVADSLAKEADFIWIGGGDRDKELLWLGDNKPTGWLSPSDLKKAMTDLDIFLFPTLWEGMPLALIQAQAAGIPAVVSNIVGNCDVVVDGETGYICDSDDDLIERTQRLIRDSELRNKMSKASQERAITNLTDRNLGTQSMAIYLGASE
ncbi:glycosyltransferase [Arthrobacter sp. TWP1-1]|uniref:glycosyltransferase n=1 Tax=Arthrobacter sp. TWP1-1 TaxID=2804568 RepID=UPI003CE9A48E